MSVFYAACAAAIIACAIHMALSRNLLRVLLGLAMLSTGVNLALFAAGGFSTDQPPIIADGLDALGPSADPLIQAMILTAIVIGFALTLVLGVFVLRAWRSAASLDVRAIDAVGRNDTSDKREPPRA